MYIPVNCRIRHHGSHFRSNQRRSHRLHLGNRYHGSRIGSCSRTYGRNRTSQSCRPRSLSSSCDGGVGNYFNHHKCHSGSMTNSTSHSVRSLSGTVDSRSRKVNRPRSHCSSHNAFSSTGNHKTPSRISQGTIHRLSCHRPSSGDHSCRSSGRSPRSMTNRRFSRQVYCSSRYCSISDLGRTSLTCSQSATRSRSGRSRNSQWTSSPTRRKVKSYCPTSNSHSKNG